MLNDGTTIVGGFENTHPQILVFSKDAFQTPIHIDDAIIRIIAVDQETILAIGDRTHIINISKKGPSLRSIGIGLSHDSQAYARGGLIHVLSGGHAYVFNKMTGDVMIDQDLTSMIRIPWHLLDSPKGMRENGTVRFAVSEDLILEVVCDPEMHAKGYRVRRRTKRDKFRSPGNVRPSDIHEDGVWTALHAFKDFRFDLVSVVAGMGDVRIRVGDLRYEPDTGRFAFKERDGGPIVVKGTFNITPNDANPRPNKVVALTGRGVVTLRRWGLDSRMDGFRFTKDGPKNNGNAVIIPGTRVRNVIPLDDDTRFIVCDEGPEIRKDGVGGSKKAVVQVRIVDIGPDAKIPGGRSGPIIQTRGGLYPRTNPILSPDGSWIVMQMLHEGAECVSLFNMRTGRAYPNRLAYGRLVGLEDGHIVVHAYSESRPIHMMGSYEMCRFYDTNMTKVGEHEMFAEASMDRDFSRGAEVFPRGASEGDVVFTVIDSYQVDEDRSFGRMRNTINDDSIIVKHVELRIGTWHNGHVDGITLFDTDIETNFNIGDDVHECLDMKSYRRDGGGYDYLIRRIIKLGSTYEFTWIRDGEVQKVRTVTHYCDDDVMSAFIGSDGMAYVDEMVNSVILCTTKHDIVYRLPDSIACHSVLYADCNQAVVYNESICIHVDWNDNPKVITNSRPQHLTDFKFERYYLRGPIFIDHYNRETILDIEHGTISFIKNYGDGGCIRTFEAVYGHKVDQTPAKGDKSTS